MKRRSLLGALLAGLLGVVTTAYACVPSPYRAATPTLFGAIHIGGPLYTDAPSRADEFHALYAESRSTVEQSLGPFRVDPRRVVICTTQSCQDRFGFGTIGLALGKAAILLGGEGVGKMIFTHELAHIHVKADVTLRDYFWPRIPAWFDEGLATFISADPRLTSYAPSDAAWIIQAKDFRDWKRMTTADTWPDTYGAAQSLMTDIHARIGYDGIRQILTHAKTPALFEDALARALGSDWPK